MHAVSKSLQSKTVDLSAAVQLLGTAFKSVSSMRDNFDQLMNEAKAFAAKWHLDAKFEVKRLRTAKKFYDELAMDERLKTT